MSRLDSNSVTLPSLVSPPNHRVAAGENRPEPTCHILRPMSYPTRLPFAPTPAQVTKLPVGLQRKTKCL